MTNFLRKTPTGKIRLESPHQGILESVRRYAGWKMSGNGAVEAPPYPSALRALTELKIPLLFENVEAEEAVLEAENFQPLTPKLAKAYEGSLGHLLKRSLMPHQRAAVGWWVSSGCPSIMITDAMGLGKTTTAIAMVQACLWHLDLTPERLSVDVVVVCPSSVKYNWRREIHACLGDQESVYVIDGDKKRREKCFAEMRDDQTERLWVVVNYDMLRTLTEPQLDFLQDMLKQGVAILDESHNVKNRKAQRTKAVVKMLKGFDGPRILLTGTPVRNSIEDLYSQVDICRPGTWTSYTDFCNRYLVMGKMQAGGRTFNIVRGAKNSEELRTIMDTLQIRRPKDILGLPLCTYTRVDLEMDIGTAKLYKAMRDMAIVDFREVLKACGEHTSIFSPQAQSAMTALLRCEQIAQGMVGGIPEHYLLKVIPLLGKYADKIEGRPNELALPNNSKVRYTLETVDDLMYENRPPVVFFRFNGIMFWMASQWEDNPPYIIHGGLTAEQREERVSMFQERRDRPIFCQIQGAEGFNLTGSRDVIFHGRSWVPAVNAQADSRCHRKGQTGTVSVLIPLMIDTIEGKMAKVLAAKASDGESATGITLADIERIL